MVYGSAFPAIIGLTTGIAFVIMLSLVFMPVTALTDEKIIENTKNMKEVQFFLETHPDAGIRVERNDVPSGIDVYYSVERQTHKPTGFDSGIKTKELVVRVDSFGNPSGLMLVCNSGGRGAVTFHVTMDMIANKCVVEPHNSNVAISLTTSLGIGDCFNNCPHTHTIFIYDNGTGIHQERLDDGKRVYYMFQAPQQAVKEIIDQFNSLERPTTSEEFDPNLTFNTTFIDLYCDDFVWTTKILLRVDEKTEKTLCYPGVPELKELEEKIEQIQQEYDDGIIDCVVNERNCPIYLPQDLMPEDENTGLFEIEPESEVGEPIPVDVEILVANETSIEITYSED